MSIVPRNFANHFWHVQSVTAPSPYTAQIFSLHFCCVFTFLETRKHNMPKCCIFFPSSILKWLHKNSPILINFSSMLLQLSWLFHLALLYPAPCTPSSNPHTIVHVHGSHVEVRWLLHFLHCILDPHGSSVTACLYSFIPSPRHPFSPTPSHLATIKPSSVSMILCSSCLLGCFIDSSVDWQICIYCHFVVPSFDFLK